MVQNDINAFLQVAQLLPDGNSYTWTLPFRLGEMLHMAEELFGERNCYYTILGIKFGPEDRPRIWYAKNQPHIMIHLSLQAAKDMRRACSDMAHETVHLLAPIGSKYSTNLEEGVACYFTNYYMKEKFNEPPVELGENDSDYKYALEAVTRLFHKDKYFVRKLRRESQRSFRDITKEDLSRGFPDLTRKEVCFLTSQLGQGSDS